MEEVARRVGRGNRNLYINFPDACRAIAARYAEVRQREIDERRQRLEDEVAGATGKLKAQGIYPSLRKFVVLLNKPTYKGVGM